MPKLFFLSFAYVLLLQTIVFSQEVSEYLNSNVATFTLKIEGLKEIKGEVRIAMFDSSEDYTKEPIYAVVIPVKEGLVNWSLDNLPYGEYAIAVYHDKNTNGKLDTNMLGIPKERYGFSNNARGKFGPASWNDAKFVVNDVFFKQDILIK